MVRIKFSIDVRPNLHNLNASISFVILTKDFNNPPLLYDRLFDGAELHSTGCWARSQLSAENRPTPAKVNPSVIRSAPTNNSLAHLSNLSQHIFVLFL